MAPYPPPATTAASQAAAWIVSRAIQQQIAAPVAAALREWRRTLRVPDDALLWERRAARPTPRRVRRGADHDLGMRVLAGAEVVADPWALATASWRTAAAVHSGLVLRRIWSLPRRAPAVLRSRDRAPGTPLGDLRLLTDSRASGREQLAALERTVDRIHWRPRSTAARRELAANAGAPGGIDEAKRREVRAAVYLVLAERGRAQAHRFGRVWLTGDDGRPAAAVPEHLDDTLYWRWFCDEVPKAAEASLLGDTYPASGGAPPRRPGTERATAVDGPAPASDEPVRRFPRSRLTRLSDAHLESLEDPSPGPAEVLVAREREREGRESWRAALAAASPRQRDLLRLLASRCAQPATGAEDDAGASVESLADAARRLGIAPSTARVQWKRLVDRLHANRAAHHPADA